MSSRFIPELLKLWPDSMHVHPNFPFTIDGAVVYTEAWRKPQRHIWKQNTVYSGGTVTCKASHLFLTDVVGFKIICFLHKALVSTNDRYSCEHQRHIFGLRIV